MGQPKGDADPAGVLKQFNLPGNDDKAGDIGLGKIDEDQLKEYSERKGISLQEARKWLNPNLADGI